MYFRGFELATCKIAYLALRTTQPRANADVIGNSKYIMYNQFTLAFSFSLSSSLDAYVLYNARAVSFSQISTTSDA